MGKAVPELVPHCPVHPDLPLEARRRGWHCPVCTRRVLSFRQWPRPSAPEPLAAGGAGLASLPWLVATPLAGARDGSRSEEVRQDFARAAAFATVRLVALLLLCEARANGDSALAVAVGRLALPGWRPWLDLASELVRGARARPSRFGNLLAAWSLLETTGGINLLSAMIPAPGGDARRCREVEPATVERIACTLLGSEPTLLRAVDGTWNRAIPLHGVAAGRLWRAGSGLDPAAAPADSLVVAWDEGGALPLEPFLLPGELVATPDGTFLGEPALALLVAIADGGLYQGLGAPVRRCGTWESLPAGETRGPAARVSRQEAAPAAAAETRRRIAAIRGRPWHAGPLLPRPEVEQRLAAALRLPGRAVVVAGEAGTGTTVLLARLAAHLLGETQEGESSPPFVALASGSAADPDVVALLSGPGVWARAGDRTGRRTLARVVARALGAEGGAWDGLEALLAAIHSSSAADRRLGRKVWLLLDGLDEDEHGAELLAALDSALPELATCPWLRLVVGLNLATCRRLVAPAGGAAAWFENERFVESFADPATGRRRPWLEVPPLSPTVEVPLAYAARQRLDPARACPLPHASLPLASAGALANPLRLQLFHASPPRLAVPPAELDLHALMASFWVRRGEAGGFSFSELAARLWAARSPALTLAETWAWTERWLGSLADPHLHAARCSPVEALLEGGLLVPPELEGAWPPPPGAGLVTPHPVVAESLLWFAARRAADERHAPPSDALAACLALPPGRWSLRHELAGALRALASRLADTAGAAALAPLLGAGDREVAAIALSGVVAAALSGRADLASWAEAALGDPEACSRLLRALTVAGADEGVAEALAPFRQRLLEAAVEHFPLEPVHRLRLAAARLAAAHRARRPSDALRLLREARADLAAVVARWPASAGTLAVRTDTLVELGALAALCGHEAEAEVALRQGVPLARARLAAEPTDAGARRTLAAALVTLAWLAAAAGRRAEAERLLGESASLVSAMRAAEPEAPDNRRLWGRLLHASGVAARAQHRRRAFCLLEEAVAALAPLAGASGSASDMLAYARAAVDFAAVAAEERATQASRTALEEGLRALASGEAGRDPVFSAAEGELSAGLALFARDPQERRELSRRACDLLAPSANEEGAPRRVVMLWREVCERLREPEPRRTDNARTAAELDPSCD